MRKTLASVIVAFMIVAMLGVSLLTIAPIQDAEARRIHDCGHNHLVWNEQLNEWEEEWHDDWRFHNHNGPHEFTCGCHN